MTNIVAYISSTTGDRPPLRMRELGPLSPHGPSANRFVQVASQCFPILFSCVKFDFKKRRTSANGMAGNSLLMQVNPDRGI